MFTGIISDVGQVRAVLPGGDTGFHIATSYATAEIALGASISCAGVCLSVTATGPDWFGVTASAETLSCTTLGRWRVGTRVNLERARADNCSIRQGDMYQLPLPGSSFDAVVIATQSAPRR